MAWTTGDKTMMVSVVVFGALLGSIALLARSCRTEPPDPRVLREATAQVEYLRPTIEKNGARLSYHPDTPQNVTVTLPGPVSEYEAQRLAATVAPWLPKGGGVRVLDNTGLERAMQVNR